MTILLTGSNGLTGQKLVTLLASQDNVSLIASSRGPNRHPLKEGYQYEPADLTDPFAWKKIFASHRPDAVIHTAAITMVDYCEDNKDLCDAINVTATALLTDLCKQHGTKMVYLSTDFVFDGKNGPYREEDPVNPPNYYGASKWKAEEIIRESGINHAILRTILLYGVSPEMSRSNIILWVKKSLEEKKPIRVVNDQYRCPTLVEDLAIASWLAIAKNASGTFHISGPELMSVVEIACRAADFWGLDKSLISETDSASLNERAKRPAKTGFVLDKAREVLGYEPVTLEQGLAVVDGQLT
jgi:dTDP-4-dehydrorhamnose reductase